MIRLKVARRCLTHWWKNRLTFFFVNQCFCFFAVWWTQLIAFPPSVRARARARVLVGALGREIRFFFSSIARICCTNIDPLQTLCNWIFPTKLSQQFFNFVNGNVWNVKSRVTWLEMNLVPWCGAPFRFVLIRFLLNWFKFF